MYYLTHTVTVFLADFFGKCDLLNLQPSAYLIMFAKGNTRGGGGKGFRILHSFRYYSRRCFGLIRQENSWTSIWVIVAAFAVLHVCLLRSSPQHKSCWSCRQLPCVTQFFLSPLFLYFFNLEFRNLLLSVPFVLTFYSLCSVFSHCLFTLFPDLPCFLFKSVIFSFLFSYYSILSASPLCSFFI